MKKVIQKLMLAMLITLGIAVQTKAQYGWINSGASGNVFAQPDNTGLQPNWTRSIGIGYFNTAGTYPQSFLHINTNGMLLPQNNSIFSLGEVFRTDCPTGLETNWKMLSGGTLMGRLFNSGNDNNLQIEASNNDLLFNTGGANERMRILSNGNVGIGNTSAFTPQNLLHLNANGSTSLFMQWTNSNIGMTATNGLLIGILGDGTAELNQQEGASMNFLTSGSPRMTIDANGYVGIGTKTPKVKLEVADGDIAVTTIGKGLILKATDGDNYYRITIDNTGKLNTELITKL